MRMLDLFCGAGGASMGYAQAGFELTGVDHRAQPRYPFAFVQADAIEFASGDLSAFDAVHASPPCQRFTKLAGQHGTRELHPDLLDETRELLIASGLPWIIENVEEAPMLGDAPLLGGFVLCGSMFGLRVRRHRLFETSFSVCPPPCAHHKQGQLVAVYGNTGGSSKRDGIKHGGVATWRDAMGIEWMKVPELRQAIPPAYSRFIGEQLVQHLKGETR